jgi:hypothetical protein
MNKEKWGRVVSTKATPPLTIMAAGRRTSNNSTVTQRGDRSLQSRNTSKPLNFHEVIVNHIPRIMIEQ